MSKISEKHITYFIASFDFTLDQFFITRGVYGDLAGYTLKDGRKFDLVIESEEFERAVIDYLLQQGVRIEFIKKV